MASITFLGTGGGRFVTQSQVRHTGGLWLGADGKDLMVDPGVGTLIRALESKKDLKTLDAILVSHNHLDHYNDAEACLEGMTDCMSKKRGTLFVNENVSKYISQYHKDMVDFQTFGSIGSFEIEGVKVDTIPTFDHSDAFGFRFGLRDGVITYSSDTNYDDELVRHYEGSDILILNVLRPDHLALIKHLTVGEAKRLIRASQPKKAVITHFGHFLATSDMDKVAREITAQTGVETLAARDRMVVEL